MGVNSPHFKIFTMKKVKETLLETAKRISLGYWNRDYKDVFVLFPSQSVYVNTKPSELEEHIIATKQKVVIVKEDGVVVEVDEEFKDEVVAETKVAPVYEKKKLKKKL